MKEAIIIVIILTSILASPYFVYIYSYMSARGRWNAIRDIKSNARIFKNLTNMKKHGKEN